LEVRKAFDSGVYSREKKLTDRFVVGWGRKGKDKLQPEPCDAICKSIQTGTDLFAG
jgi:hypothetical protein